jgi:hypothetical protein
MQSPDRAVRCSRIHCSCTRPTLGGRAQVDRGRQVRSGDWMRRYLVVVEASPIVARVFVLNRPVWYKAHSIRGRGPWVL